MRRLQTREKIERKRKSRTTILSILMLSILILSIIGFAFLSFPNSRESDEEIISDKISIHYQGNSFNLLSSINDIANISVNITITPASYSEETLYIDSDNQGIFQELGSTIGMFSPSVQKACYGACKENLPEKNCTDNLIIWEESTENKVFQEEKCIFIEGDMRSADAFLYTLFT